MRKLGILITILVVVIVTTLLGLRSWYQNGLEANFSKDLAYILTVNPGDSTGEILNLLESEDIIRSAFAAKIYLKFNPTTIQAGEFEVNTYMDVPTILKVLEDAEDGTVWVTIPEGLRYDEIAEIWTEKVSGFSSLEFIRLCEERYNHLPHAAAHPTVEGYLFPDTYNVKEDATEREIFELLTETFTEKVGVVEYEILVLASIVEREARTNDERPIVAGILKKRLDTYGWLIQADATLLYEHKDWTKTITPVMLNSDSPYNSYTNPNLPPTPICNPGLSSINAARKPEDSKYWFYLHSVEEDGTTEIRYATTQEEHNQNIYKYLY